MLCAQRIELLRRQGALRAGPASVEAATKAWERRRAAHREQLARLSRALLVTFPLVSPRAAVLLDVGEHAISTFVDDGLDALRARLTTYDVIGGLQVRARLRALAFDSGERRLAELEPPQKTRQLNRRGRTLKVTTTLLVQDRAASASRSERTASSRRTSPRGRRVGGRSSNVRRRALRQHRALMAAISSPPSPICCGRSRLSTAS